MRQEGKDYRGSVRRHDADSEGTRSRVQRPVGDPEAEAIFPLMDEDLAPLLLASAHGQLQPRPVRFSGATSVCVVLAAGGYPNAGESGRPITGLDTAGGVSDALVFHAGTSLRDGVLVSGSGRVLTVVGRGPTYQHASTVAYRRRVASARDHCKTGDIAARRYRPTADALTSTFRGRDPRSTPTTAYASSAGCRVTRRIVTIERDLRAAAPSTFPPAGRPVVAHLLVNANADSAGTISGSPKQPPWDLVTAATRRRPMTCAAAEVLQCANTDKESSRVTPAPDRDARPESRPGPLRRWRRQLGEVLGLAGRAHRVHTARSDGGAQRALLTSRRRGASAEAERGVLGGIRHAVAAVQGNRHTACTWANTTRPRRADVADGDGPGAGQLAATCCSHQLARADGLHRRSSSSCIVEATGAAFPPAAAARRDDSCADGRRTSHLLPRYGRGYSRGITDARSDRT